jgi:hypothetical protein
MDKTHHEKLTENKHTIDAVRDTEILISVRFTNGQQAEKTETYLFSKIRNSPRGAVIVEDVNYTYAHIGYIANCVDIFNSEVNKLNQDSDRVKEARYADDFNLV